MTKKRKKGKNNSENRKYDFCRGEFIENNNNIIR
jgi:hypothetical protein